jgi:hypothetical protein
VSVEALIRRAQASGVALRLVGGKVKAIGPREAVAHLLVPLRAYRAALAEALQTEPLEPMPSALAGVAADPDSPRLAGDATMSLLAMLQKGGLQRFATAIPATFATDAPLILPKVATVATVAVANHPKPPANNPTPTTTTAMNPRDRDTHTARLARFTDKGVIHDDAQLLADKLLIRDRDSDDRRLCLECTHLTGYGHSSWRCSNWQRAGVAIRARDNQLPVDLVLQLQRCDGLTHAFNPTTEVS